MNKVVPINVDRNVSPAYFRALTDARKLLVTSVFYTFQGEGPFAGQPAVFIRLAGCNIGSKADCPFCDTYFNVDSGMQLTVDQLCAEVAKLWPGGYGSGRTPLVVVTGGEPLLQWPMLQKLIVALQLQGQGDVRVQLETNGMYLREEHMHWASQQPLTIVVSPKVSASLGRYPEHAVRPEWFTATKPPVLKFVVSADPASPYYVLPLCDLVRADVDSDLVYVSGMTDYTETTPTMPDQPVNLLTDFSDIARRRTALNWQRAANLALRHGFNVSLQTHLLTGVQ